MKIEIKLKNNKLCTGCPCLKIKDEGHNYYSKCGLGYNTERKAIYRGDIGNYHHPDLVDHYETPRPSKCIIDNQE